MDRPLTPDHFAQRLRVAAAVADIQGRVIAQHLGISPAAVSKWMGGRCRPSLSHLVELCRLLGCTMDWLMTPEPVDVRDPGPSRPNSVMQATLEEAHVAIGQALDKVRRAALKESTDGR